MALFTAQQHCPQHCLLLWLHQRLCQLWYGHRLEQLVFLVLVGKSVEFDQQ
jgi:hypothetical protein